MRCRSRCRRWYWPNPGTRASTKTRLISGCAKPCAKVATPPGWKPNPPDLQAMRGQNVGGGLLPIAVCQTQIFYLIQRNREQAPSHKGSIVNPGLRLAHLYPANM
ncbi:hypothetical protein EMIT0357P_190013 [Pseudomonas marginalis]